MKIALIGYGKMGKAIEEIALSQQHDIVLRITRSNVHEFTMEQLQQADVCIEFSTPETAYNNVMKCLEAGVPTVCGTTAWLDQLEEVKTFAATNKVSFIYASNFSIGVNLFFAINRFTARLMHKHPEYKVALEEIHHTQKKDAPSGTAVSLAEDVLGVYTNLQGWKNDEEVSPRELSVVSKRIDPAPGTHSIFYRSDIDDIEIKHTAHSRKGFASGAVLAAEYIVQHKGLFTMQDVLGLCD